MPTESAAPSDPVSEYKEMLTLFLERRPSGTRQKLAAAIGTHKSFISQVTNSAYRVPLPAQHIPAVFRVCHLSEAEQERFLNVYRRAHPAQSAALAELASMEKGILKIPIPPGMDDETRRDVEQVILDFADRVIGLVQGRKK